VEMAATLAPASTASLGSITLCATEAWVNWARRTPVREAIGTTASTAERRKGVPSFRAPGRLVVRVDTARTTFGRHQLTQSTAKSGMLGHSVPIESIPLICKLRDRPVGPDRINSVAFVLLHHRRNVDTDPRRLSLGPVRPVSQA